MRLSDNFDSHEFDCRCCHCGGHGMHPQLISALEQLRCKIDSAITIVSGFRCLRYNMEDPDRAPNSRHLFGEAADLRLPPEMTAKQFAKIAEQVEAFANGGIGIYKEFIHVDVRWVSGMSKARW